MSHRTAWIVAKTVAWFITTAAFSAAYIATDSAETKYTLSYWYGLFIGCAFLDKVRQ